ncbi:KH domain-containing protein [Planococcus sp. CP5-4]|uniref:RNA-binding protein KhpA n=1 Tax=Planococcus citreus TaxID=1373 RepID=A0A497YGT9_9BACL|nr:MULTISPECIES: KH domain-containing protein [Planococcus]MDN5709310.1 KH domain-containing protein [Planococcus sp. (in: firmicutes)]AUD14110.1 RNA-binding protein [Planococcus sp. MB-3u-03]MBU9672093.1 KH domain-containing protein [Planococcus sp. CP5-4_YE]MBV0907656.1 KH domain-containing protein [Planococcus sp. CP5-4_UN]MBW6062823.1 KH domain-containing protein [Planococcus sp. CP5-4]
MEQLIETIVKPLVDYPEAVRIEKDENTNRVVYKLSVHQSDTGKVIGKQGRVAKAVRSVVYSAAGNYHKKKTYLDIVD